VLAVRAAMPGRSVSVAPGRRLVMLVAPV